MIRSANSRNPRAHNTHIRPARQRSLAALPRERVHLGRGLRVEPERACRVVDGECCFFGDVVDDEDLIVRSDKEVEGKCKGSLCEVESRVIGEENKVKFELIVVVQKVNNEEKY